jgi:hypothetical protein
LYRQLWVLHHPNKYSCSYDLPGPPVSAFPSSLSSPGSIFSSSTARTGVSGRAIVATTLNEYRGKLYRTRNTSGQLRWILPLQLYHRKFLGFGLQYCSQCLLEDDEPYFRRRWRVAYCTFCPEHNALLRDRCWQCGACVAFHRRELGRPTLLLVGLMSICHSCGHDLRAASPLPIPLYNQESHLETIELLKSLESNHGADPRFGLSFHAMLHQQCRLIVSERTAPRFREFIQQQIKCPNMRLLNGRLSFEMRSLVERYHVVAIGHVGDVRLEGPLGNRLEVKGREVQRLAQGFGQSSSKVRLLCSTPESKLDFPAKNSW